MNRYLRSALLGLMWAAVAAYVIWAGASARRVRMAKRVGGLEIEVVDSSSQGHLVSAAMVRGWISQSGIETIGTAVDAVDLTGIERLIARNGFVDEVAAYVSYDGVLHVAISQRKPLLRLLTDGLNAYVTPEGYVFAAPRASSLYVSGGHGFVPSAFSGVVCGECPGACRSAFAGDRKPDRRNSNGRSIPSTAASWRTTAMSRPCAACASSGSGGVWRAPGSSNERVDALREKKAALRRTYRYRARVIREEIERIDGRQEAERAKQKKLEKSYEDFMKLLTFVESVENDDFWRSEVVQIAAHTTPSGALEVELTPRSGRFTILFGRLEEVERKFGKLERFYRRGLPSIGWNEYRTIDIRYNDQVVCKK